MSPPFLSCRILSQNYFLVLHECVWLHILNSIRLALHYYLPEFLKSVIHSSVLIVEGFHLVDLSGSLVHLKPQEKFGQLWYAMTGDLSAV
jgi:hypothetical protein